MEGGIANLGSPDTSKKHGLLEQNSVTTADNPASVVNRINEKPIDSGRSGSADSRRKRSRKGPSLWRFDHPVKRRRNGPRWAESNEFVIGDGKQGSRNPSTADLHDPSGHSDSSLKQGSALGLLPAKKLHDQSRSFGTPENSDKSDRVDNSATISKRRRRVSKQKGAGSSVSRKRARVTPGACSRSEPDILAGNLIDNGLIPTQESTGTKNKDFEDYKNNDSSKVSSTHSGKGTNGTSVISSRKKVRRSRKSYTSKTETNTYGGDKAHTFEDDRSSAEYFLYEDDEENLERNAARMLSSRFDPSCTGFSAKTKASTRPENESSSQPFHHFFVGSSSEVSSSVHAKGRSLRPRKNYGRGFIRKRRHFYEVRYSDMDPYWVVKQRIRVFWPLDQSWYFGLVKDYDPLTKLHYVKYDDRDEEWINLQNERFKLLLFPSELKFNSENSGSRTRKRITAGDKSIADASVSEGIMESETIISWLARSNHPRKTSSSTVDKIIRAAPLKDSEHTPLSTTDDLISGAPTDLVLNKPSSSCVAPETLSEDGIARVSKTESKSDTCNRKVHIVYFRKRYRQREGLSDNLERHSNCAGAVGPITLPASVACRESALEELHVDVTPTAPPQLRLMLCLPLKCILLNTTRAESFVLLQTILFHQGGLLPLWPMVHMELVIVDSTLGLRVLSFEGCLRRAVSLVCLVMETFDRNCNGSKLSGVQAPFTSIGLKLSGLHNKLGYFLLTLCSFVKLKSSKWDYLENELKQHCITKKELSTEDCTYGNIKNLSSSSSQILRHPLSENWISDEVDRKKSFSDVIHQLFFRISPHRRMDLGFYYFDEKCAPFPPRVHSFVTGPSFVLSMHLKLLVEKRTTALGSRMPMLAPRQDCTKNYNKLHTDGSSPVEFYSDEVSEIINETRTVSSERPSQHLKVESGLSVINDGDLARSYHNYTNGYSNTTGNLVGLYDSGEKPENETTVCPQRLMCHDKSGKVVDNSSPPLCVSSSPGKSEARYTSLNATVGQGQLSSQVEKQSAEGQRASNFPFELVREINEPVPHIPKTTASRSTLHHNRNSSVSPTFGQFSKLWPDDFIQNGFPNASKKPRTHVSYLSHAGDRDLGSRNQNNYRRERHFKKIKTDNAHKASGGWRSAEIGSLTCCANVLITVADRGWRECGAQVVLESDDQKDCRISIKILGTTKYVFKAHQVLQPGITNRYSHAMMWKGGKDWTLEFTDRSQWSVFKLMHEECFNRNIRAASLKNIPIPGVQLIDDGDENIVEAPFFRNSSDYHRQVGTEIDMALDPSHVLYDMDSSDDEWISNLKKSLDGKCSMMTEITDDMFERVIDMFEKLAYAKNNDRFTIDDIEEFMTDFGPLDLVKAIYEHWQQKRKKKGLPLIRQFQPALWEHYQKQLKEWEFAMGKLQTSSDGYQEKTHLLPKPTMFAFCLRPRGLEVPNKGSKHKSHRKFMFSGCFNSLTRGHEGAHSYGRKSNGISIGDDKALFHVPDYETNSNLLRSSSSVLSKDSARTVNLRVANDRSGRNRDPNLHRYNSKRSGMSLSPRDVRSMPFMHNEVSKKSAIHCSGADMCELSHKSRQPHPDDIQKHRVDTNEFRLRDASGAAQHALNMAKLKREKAQWWLQKADLAVHKAMVAVMTAEAIKASHPDSIGDG